MIQSRKRMLGALAAVVVIGAAVAIFGSHCLIRQAEHVSSESPASKSANVRAPADPIAPIVPIAPAPEKTFGWRWGGALNSAREDGAGFFDRKASREFLESVA